jgi:CxxC motif-containing protein
MKGRELTCIVCPIGCRLHITFDGDTINSISGNRCKRGSAYAREECTAPKRVLTTTVRVGGGACPLVSVKTEKAVPKQMIRQCMDEIHYVQATAPVRIGDILLQNVCGTGVDIVATRNVPQA